MVMAMREAQTGHSAWVAVGLSQVRVEAVSQQRGQRVGLWTLPVVRSLRGGANRARREWSSKAEKGPRGARAGRLTAGRGRSGPGATAEQAAAVTTTRGTERGGAGAGPDAGGQERGRDGGGRFRRHTRLGRWGGSWPGAVSEAAPGPTGHVGAWLRAPHSGARPCHRCRRGHGEAAQPAGAASPKSRCLTQRGRPSTRSFARAGWTSIAVRAEGKVAAATAARAWTTSGWSLTAAAAMGMLSALGRGHRPVRRRGQPARLCHRSQGHDQTCAGVRSPKQRGQRPQVRRRGRRRRER